MAEDNKNIPVENEDNTNNTPGETPDAPASNEVPVNSSANTPPANTPPVNKPPATPPAEDFEDDLGDRLERLGGEPAPVITPEEFARLQKAGQVHIDARGRVRTARRTNSEAGVSLRKRRAWYVRGH